MRMDSAYQFRMDASLGMVAVVGNEADGSFTSFGILPDLKLGDKLSIDGIENIPPSDIVIA